MIRQAQSTFVVQGLWYDGVTSRAQAASLRLWGNQVVLQVDGETEREAGLADVVVSPRLGNSPRYLTFGGSGRFETRDNRQLDQWLGQQRRAPWHQLLHRLESRWHWVLVSLLLVIAFVWGLLRFALPLAAYELAQRLPSRLEQVLGEETLSFLDQHYLRPTGLSEQQQQQVQATMQPLLQEHPHLQLRLLFRDGGVVGANALALPDGTLVLTDQLVALAATEEELLAVLAHEVGHVAYKHSLQALVRSSLLGFTLMFIAGDVSATSELLLGAPVVLLELSFSRNFEREADAFARQYLQRRGIALHHFVHLMERLERAGRCRTGGSGPEPAESTSADALQCYRDLASQQAPSATTGGGDNNWFNYLSTHPPTRERLERFHD